MGALTHPHGRSQDKKSKDKKTNPNGRPRRKELVIVFPQRRSLGLKPVRTSCAATFTTAVPPPGVHPELALAASTSQADEPEPAAFCGSEEAFPARWRDGDWTTRSVLAAGSPPADYACGTLGGCLEPP